ncbi:MAG TPA: hypothetical protein VIV54_10545 [Burkholderiales bacterium]
MVVVVVSDFVVSEELGVLLEDELELGLLLGVLLEDELELGGVVVAPAPAVPLPLVDEELDGLVDEEPPLALSFFWMSTEVDEELEPDGAVLGAAVVPADEDEEPDGEVVAPEGAVVDEELDERSAPRSHAVSSVAPSAMETATAMAESLMWPPWLGYVLQRARIGPRMLRSNQSRTTPARGFT